MNQRKFQKHLRAPYPYANRFNHRVMLWGGAGVLVTPTPKSAASFPWLLGYKHPSTAIFTPLPIHFLCADFSKATKLEALRAAAFTAVGADLSVRCTFTSYHANPSDEVLPMVIDQTQREVARCSAAMGRGRSRSCGEGAEENEGPRRYPVITAGCIAEEQLTWGESFEFDEEWKKKKLAAKGFELVRKDATLGFSRLARTKSGQQNGKLLEGGGNEAMDEMAAHGTAVPGEVEEGVAEEHSEGSGAGRFALDGMEKPVLDGDAEAAGEMEDTAATCAWEVVSGCEVPQDDLEEAAGLEVGGSWVLLGDTKF